MLISCPECKKEVSNEALSCPHCGHPLKPTAELQPPLPIKGKAPIFLILSVIALVLTLGTPRFLALFPIMGVLGCAVISLFRKERGKVMAAISLLLGIGVWVLNEMPSATTAQRARLRAGPRIWAPQTQRARLRAGPRIGAPQKSWPTTGTRTLTSEPTALSNGMFKSAINRREILGT